jgi:nicotinamide-nucleotide amidase
VKSAILCIGTEITTGLVKDINAHFLAFNLTAVGLSPKLVLFVPDQKETITKTLQFIFEDEEIQSIFITGGLGPTQDDLTREILAEVIGKKLCFMPEQWDNIIRFYQKIRNTLPPENNKKQAFIPEGSLLLENPLGTAPGFVSDFKDKKIFVIPGIPKETEYFWPIIKTHLPSNDNQFYRSEMIKICGVGESQFETELQPFLSSLPDTLQSAYLPVFGEVWFYLYSYQKNHQVIQSAENIIKKIKEVWKSFLFSQWGNTLEQACGKLLREKRLTIAAAESCSGGLLSHRLTNIPGSSAYFYRGYVVYSNQAKIDTVGVPSSLIAEYGAVSEEVARALAEGVREKSHTDIGIGITGIAGPSGGSKQKPVGLVYIGISNFQHTQVKKHLFSGDREVIKMLSTQSALTQLFLQLQRGINDER